MKLKDSFFYTLREDVKDEDSKSGNLLVRGGFIKKTSAGVYMTMPLGLRVMKKIENIVREEMNKAGANELLMPCLIPEEVYIKSGRRDNFGNSMFTLDDRNNRKFALGPTHEELFVLAAKEKIRSYKDMPFNIYQFGTKFRDEARPRFGLIRVREFIMKDAYSFDTDESGLDNSYKKMFNAYKNIFDRMGIDYKIVKADTGAMGGLLSEEFQAVTEIGEDVLVLCDNCNYASNLEVSKSVSMISESDEAKLDKELVDTPNAGTIEEVSNYMGETKDKFVKTLIYKANDEFYAVMVAGNRDVNEVKLAKLLKVNEVVLAESSEVEEVTKAKVGFAGPIGLSCKVVADQDVMKMTNFIVGANQDDKHYKNVNIDDFNIDYEGDIKLVKEGDICPVCEGHLVFKKGIEIGNTFKLGIKYSDALGLQYLDQNNKLQTVWMGSYGIGIGRIMAAVAEQNCTDKGIVWPNVIAPFKLGIVLINDQDEVQSNVANKLYDKFNELGIDTVLDDRKERPGVKFNDMELIGVPVRITVGKKAIDNIVEVKTLNSEMVEININQVYEYVSKLVEEQ